MTRWTIFRRIGTGARSAAEIPIFEFRIIGDPGADAVPQTRFRIQGEPCEAVFDATAILPLPRDEKLDSPLEGTGFELLVPRHERGRERPVQRRKWPG